MAPLPEYAAEHAENPLKEWLVLEVLGVLLGAFLSGLVSGRLTWATERGPRVGGGTRIAFALAGGTLFGIGARLARGCTSGAALTGWRCSRRRAHGYDFTVLRVFFTAALTALAGTLLLGAWDSSTSSK